MVEGGVCEGILCHRQWIKKTIQSNCIVQGKMGPAQSTLEKWSDIIYCLIWSNQ